MSRLREVSLTTRALVPVIAPGYKVGETRWTGRPEMRSNAHGEGSRRNWWQRVLRWEVRTANVGGPFKKTDIVRSPDVTLRSVITDGLRTVSSHEGRPKKPGKIMTGLGWVPGLALVYDVPATVFAVGRRLKGRDQGRILPYVGAMLTDLKNNPWMPGSARSLREPIWEFQKVEQLVFADEMQRTLKSGWSDDINHNAAINKYLRIAHFTLNVRQGEIASARKSMVNILEAVNGKMPKKDKKALRENGDFPELTLAEMESAGIHQYDQVRYVIGRNLLNSLNLASSMLAQVSVPERPMERASSLYEQGPRRRVH